MGGRKQNHRKNTNGKPTLLFEPFYRKPKSYNGLTNTDPFVFGDTFHYVTCQQFKKDRPCTLHNLQAGDVILFGSYKGAQFTLDTVLVIADSVLIDTANYATDIKNKKVSKVYDDVVLKTLAPQTKAVCAALPAGGCDTSCGSTGIADIPEPQMTRLYFGATVDNPVHGMYSFCPCKPFEEKNWGFSRPVITLPGVITPNQLQGHKLNPQSDIKNSVRLWDEVRQQVFKSGLCLGTSFDLPNQVR